jgi:hypothetical protein
MGRELGGCGPKVLESCGGALRLLLKWIGNRGEPFFVLRNLKISQAQTKSVSKKMKIS